jgi:hypothetical protein
MIPPPPKWQRPSAKAFATLLCSNPTYLAKHSSLDKEQLVRFQVLTAASMMFRVVFWDHP